MDDSVRRIGAGSVHGSIQPSNGSTLPSRCDLLLKPVRVTQKTPREGSFLIKFPIFLEFPTSDPLPTL